MMQSSLCFALLVTTAAALQAPTSRAGMRRGVARAPMVGVLAPTSSALCAADDDGYEAPKIEFDPDADVGGRDLWSDWKNGIYIGSVAIGVLLPLFFFVVRP
mmetsp:Transcript_20770/g.58720  ORF Transcript_20770/g.58720 Transcript_20770/m.58720 type:complete len:102 (+) Transcript_20770:68-373(+)